MKLSPLYSKLLNKLSNRMFKSLFLVLLFVMSPVFGAFGTKPTLLVTVRPLYGVGARLLEGIGTPELLLESNISPHVYQLKPSDVKRIQEAPLVFWVGPSYEAYLDKAMKRLPQDRWISFENTPEVKRHPMRIDGLWEDEAPMHNSHNHSHSHHHHGGEWDGHFWLDPENVRVVSIELCKKLIEKNPEHRKALEKNLESFLKDIEALKSNLKKQIEGKAPQGLLVFHDAYQYLEHAFGIPVMGSVLLEPDMPARAHHLERLRQLIKNKKCSCIASEPQFSRKLIDKIVEEHQGIRTILLDPLGSNIPLGLHHYEKLLTQLVFEIGKCP